MVKFSVADNLDDALAPEISSYGVDEIFGKLSADVIGGGRSSFLIPSISKKRFAKRVAQVQGEGIAYNYLLNAACGDNRGLTRGGQKKIRSLLDWVCSLGIRRVTVASAFLLRLIKENYPEISVRISVFAGVDHVRKAKMWEEMGADCITLDSILVNREFASLRSIRQGVKIDLQLLVNNSCLTSCALSPEHMNLLAHSSQQGHHTKGFAPDYCFLYCSRKRLEEPVNYIRADWIRPEDIGLYEKIGYDSFKITERSAPTHVMVARVKAYTKRKYEGNLLDLTQPYSYPKSSGGARAPRPSLLRQIITFAKPWKVNPARLLLFAKLASAQCMISPREGEPPVYVDNKKLDGFASRFESIGCKDLDCDDCRYCHEWADKTVTIDASYKKELLKLYAQVVKSVESGALWRYGA
ncbi:hypothetical protein MNBD_NITROSPINAE02-2088 [hydrothermal vent metagenome]|uniref:Peptidase U32 n=1 Tax=hydrothermal vent metagenome TaxID=652676 RepID=A0A3B1C012_9ZZZZ